MTCEICGTTANVLHVLLWQRERHEYCAACATRVRPTRLELSDTWSREFSGPMPLVLPFYICPCGVPLMPLMRVACDHVDDYHAVGEPAQESPRCEKCGKQFQLLVSVYACQTCGSESRPTFLPWQPRLSKIVFDNPGIPYASEDFWRQVFQNPN